MDCEDILLSDREEIPPLDFVRACAHTCACARGAKTWPKNKALLPKKNHKVSCLKRGGKGAKKNIILSSN